MVEHTTQMSGPGDFPSTVWSRLVSGAGDGASTDYLATHYWRPAYLFIRRKWRKNREDASDLTQGFFAEAMQSGLLSKATPERGSFRRFLRASIENFLRNDYRDSRALKRGGGLKTLSIHDLDEAESLVTREGNPQELFDRDWLDSVFRRCLPVLLKAYEDEGRRHYYDIFCRYELNRPSGGGPTYDVVAREFGLSTDDIRNHLHNARARWKKLVLEEFREMSATPDDLEREVRDLFPPGS